MAGSQNYSSRRSGGRSAADTAGRRRSSSGSAKKKQKVAIARYANGDPIEGIRWEGVQYFDYGLLVMVMLLFAFGLIMLYSTSAYMATLQHDDSLYFLKRQVFAGCLGVAAIIGINSIGYQSLKAIAFPLYCVGLGLCVLVIFAGTSLNNSSRWLYIGGISIQPSEILKISVIIVLAALISDHARELKFGMNVMKLFALILPAVAIVAVNNLSTAIIIMGIAFGMLFVASPNIRIFVLLGAVGVGAVALFIPFAGYRSERIDIWMHPENYEKGYQTLQGLYAIGSGGLFGKGLGESMQKLGYVPEAQNDMIFSIICEELGIFGAVCVILMHILLLWRFMIIAINAKDIFGSFLCIGIMIHIALQVILNIAVVTNSIPNTGITLPFVSYGGTSIAILMAEMGLAMSVSRGISMK